MGTIASGRDIGTTLPDLLDGISAIEGDFRVRVGMMNPSLLPPLLDRLMDAFDDRRIYKFFHIPFQSGSADILKSMKRGYSPSQFLDIVARIRERYPDMTLSTDLIAGFPGETERDFDESLRVMSAARPDVVNVTRFSARPGTPAVSMPGEVHGRIAKERSRRATRLRFLISGEKNAAYVCSTVRVLVTEKGKNGYVIGRLGNYRQAIVKGNHRIGSMIDCRVTGSTPIHLVCEQATAVRKGT
jgi:MiaB/RimO family radical SAM methylthiotransferase